MYAVIRAGGKQYRVEPGDTLKVEKFDGDVGSKVELKDVLMVEDDGQRYSINAGIGIVVPSKQVLETINQDSLVSKRQKIANRTNS